MSTERAEPNVIRTCPVCARVHVVPLSEAAAYFKDFDGGQCREHPKSAAVLTLDETKLT